MREQRLQNVATVAILNLNRSYPNGVAFENLIEQKLKHIFLLIFLEIASHLSIREYFKK